MYSKVIIVGNIGNQPEMRYLPNGDPVTSFSLATNKTWLKDGVKQEKVTWWRVTCWRKLAEVVNQYCTKGSRVLVEGEDVEVRAYTNKTTSEPAASLEMTANVVKFLNTKGEATEIGAAAGTIAAAAVPSMSAVEDTPF